MINIIIFAGILDEDPKFWKRQDGLLFASWRVASTKFWTASNGQHKEQTEWMTCNAWGVIAERVQKYLPKGAACQVVGEIHTRSWDDKATGTKRYSTEINVNKLVQLDFLKNEERPAQGAF